MMIKCLAQGHDALSLVRLKPATPRSQVKHSTTELLRPSVLGLWSSQTLID